MGQFCCWPLIPIMNLSCNNEIETHLQLPVIPFDSTRREKSKEGGMPDTEEDIGEKKEHRETGI